MKLGLVMIVRDEEAVIERCLASALPHFDTWTVVDTGSEDRTPEIVQEALSGLPGRLLREPWVNFGENRTRALRAARGTADYQFILDADQTIDGVFPDDPTADAYLIEIRDTTPFRYRIPILLRDSVPWVFAGETHEGLGADQHDPVTREPLDTLFVMHHLDGHRRPRKWIDDLVVLWEAHKQNPGDPRTTFYLAQTFADLGMIPQAIETYRLRVEMTGDPEERFYAQYRLGCLLAANVSFSDAADVLLDAWRERPTRIESLRALANAANHVADKTPIPDDILFVHHDQYA